MKPKNLIGFPYLHLQEFLLEHGIKPYRAHQIFIWLYHYKLYDFDLMSNLSKKLRSLLKEHFYKVPNVERRSHHQKHEIHSL